MRNNKTFGWTLAGGAALGAALMYLLDPKNGRRRRSLAVDKTGKWAREGGGKVAAAGRHVSNRSVGVFREMRGKLGGDRPDDRVLAERVRAQAGHALPPSAELDVEAHRGRVTLRGRVPASELDAVLGLVRSVPGVETVDNRLRVSPELAPVATG
jgi:osmotically-inducible protein OsmY